MIYSQSYKFLVELTVVLVTASTHFQIVFDHFHIDSFTITPISPQSIKIAQFSSWKINNFEKFAMATASIANFGLISLGNSVFATINKLRKQHKRADLDKIYNE